MAKKQKPIVAVLKTHPDNVLNDYARLMHLAEYTNHLSKKDRTVIKLNLSWSLYYPACSTEPWQLEGVLKTLKKDNFKKLIGVENQTVVTNPWKGAYLNKWLPLLEKYHVPYQPLTNVEWVPFKPKKEMLAMSEIFNPILVPKMFKGTNVVHLPTVKTHGHTVMTGSMKNAFGGLIPKYRHHAHRKIHEVLVDLLAIQQQLHKGVFAVMDGTVAGDGAGPRTMIPFIGNAILASADQVAIDAVSAKIMGYNPMKIPFIKIAHDKGLGIGDIDQIEIAGMSKNEFRKINFHFNTKKSPVIKWDQRLRKGTYHIKPLHNALFHSPVFKTFIFASEFYHDKLWYPTIGKRNIDRFSDTDWGRLFETYGYGKKPKTSKIGHWDPY
jgi:uncharacterized protein (DUF362 family)